MNRSLLEILVDPATKSPLEIMEVHAEAGGSRIDEGTLQSMSGHAYPIVKGIPRFVLTEDRDQKQTQGSFGFKWEQRGSFESEDFHGFYREWLRQKYGFSTEQEMRDYFGSRDRTLEVGCGAGLSSCVSLSGWEQNQQWVGVDISTAVDVASERLRHVPTAHFVQADILQLPFREGSFDTIFAEGVLHHTPSTEAALKALVPLLAVGGEILFYVYRKKGPVREFTDDCIREQLAPLPPEEAWEALRPLTKLGQALAELQAEVEVPEDIPYLGIKAGRYDVQRLIYWHFAKMYWNDDFPFETNHHINFDWYHPRFAHRQTKEDVYRWCEQSGLSISYFHEQESGFTVRALKR